MPKSLPPGFEFSENLVAGKLKFDTIRLETDERFNRDDRTEGKWLLSEEAREAVVTTIGEYYEHRPSIEENVNVNSEFFSLRVLPEDAKTVADLLAQNLEIKFRIPDFGLSDTEEQPNPINYTELIGEVETVTESSWEELADLQFDVDEAIEKVIPEGHTNATFSYDDYLEYLTDYLIPAVKEAGWKGGHAWLLNLGLQELRNGRYEEAAYAFEGAKDGLTKHSLFGESNIQPPVKRALDTLRDLCLFKAPDQYEFGGFDLYWRADLRNLIYIPKFTSEPTLDDIYFRMNNQLWIANALVLVQGIAHAIGRPNISRSEVDPFGSNMTVRNASFVLKLADKLATSANGEKSKSGHIHYLEAIDFGSLTPDVTITRTLRSAGYDIHMYGKRGLEFPDEFDIEFDLIVSRGDDLYIARTMRPEDRDINHVKKLAEEIDSYEDVDHKLLFLYDRELDTEKMDGISSQDNVKMAYIDLQSERISPFSSGYPRNFADFTTDEEIREEIDRLYQEAEKAEDTETKGNRLEDLMEFIFEKAVPDTDTMMRNNRTSTEEIDLQLQNKEKNHPWTQLGAPINVECKNWSKPVGVDVIYSVYGKSMITSSNSNGAILVSWEGVSDSQSGRNADGLLSKLRGSELDILTIDKNDLAEIAETGDAQGVFERAYAELYQR